MAEPVSSAAGAYSAGKFALASGLGAVAAGLIMMMLAYPKSKREFVAAMVSTLALSIFGGSAAVEYFHVPEWGAMAQAIMYFLCGLPAWILVRAFFAWAEKNKEKDLVEIVSEIKHVVKD